MLIYPKFYAKLALNQFRLEKITRSSGEGFSRLQLWKKIINCCWALPNNRAHGTQSGVSPYVTFTCDGTSFF
jgi:hypothetical protein